VLDDYFADVVENIVVKFSGLTVVALSVVIVKVACAVSREKEQMYVRY